MIFCPGSLPVCITQAGQGAALWYGKHPLIFLLLIGGGLCWLAQWQARYSAFTIKSVRENSLVAISFTLLAPFATYTGSGGVSRIGRDRCSYPWLEHLPLSAHRFQRKASGINPKNILGHHHFWIDADAQNRVLSKDSAAITPVLRGEPAGGA